ncbi:MAG: tetratricopeptide repeat protein [Pseudomonadota bacterium]
MTRGHIVLLAIGAALAMLASWSLPRLQAPLDRFSVAMNLIADGRGSDAVHLLDDRIWRGIAEYRANRYRRAATEFVQDESVTSTYNLGTAYARLAEWTAARAAYERVLRLYPGHEDAAFNLALVLQAEARQQEEQEGQRQTRTLGTVKGKPGQSDQQDSADGEETTTEDARPSDDVARTDKEATQAGQIAAQGRTGDKAQSDDAAAGRGEVTDSEDTESTGRDGSGGMRQLTKSTQDAEILLRRIVDDPERVLAARLRAIDRLRNEAKR